MKLIIKNNSNDCTENDIVLDKNMKQFIKNGDKLDYSEEEVEYIYEEFIKKYEDEDNLKETEETKKLAQYLSEGSFIIKDVFNYLKYIHKINYEKGIYRGQKNANWKLIPSIHRKRNSKDSKKFHENNLYKNIKKQNLIEFKEQDLFINEIIRMQHYGIPTPLIDWTFNPLIGLFFATAPSDANDPQDGKVYIYNYNQDISKVNFDTEEYKIYSEKLKNIYEQAPGKTSNIKDFGENLIFIESINENNRLKAQKGLFSLDLKPYYKLYFMKNIIKTICISELKPNNALNKTIGTFLDLLKDDEDTDILSKLENYLEITDNQDKNIFKEKKPKIIERLAFYDNTNVYSQILDTKNIIILDNDKKNIRQELENIYGIDSSTVYPDLSGYIEYIKETF
ncbi:FRG domain-containing protein [Cetobacterium ceti]